MRRWRRGAKMLLKEPILITGHACREVTNQKLQSTFCRPLSASFCLHSAMGYAVICDRKMERPGLFWSF